MSLSTNSSQNMVFSGNYTTVGGNISYALGEAAHNIGTTLYEWWNRDATAARTKLAQQIHAPKTDVLLKEVFKKSIEYIEQQTNSKLSKETKATVWKRVSPKKLEELQKIQIQKIVDSILGMFTDQEIEAMSQDFTNSQKFRTAYKDNISSVLQSVKDELKTMGPQWFNEITTAVQEEESRLRTFNMRLELAGDIVVFDAIEFLSGEFLKVVAGVERQLGRKIPKEIQTKVWINVGVIQHKQLYKAYINQFSTAVLGQFSEDQVSTILNEYRKKGIPSPYREQIDTLYENNYEAMINSIIDLIGPTYTREVDQALKSELSMADK